jgi:AraC-like DNA-binding protein/quercetin dioxygenase-like cupin family protein
MHSASLVQRDLSARAVLRQWRFPHAFEGAPNAHSGVEISWCAKGSAEYEIAGRVVTLRPGAAIVIPADVEHSTSFREPDSQAHSIHVGRDAFREATEAIGARLTDARIAEGTVDRPSTLATLGSLLAREADDERGGKALAIEALTDAVVAVALRTEDEPARTGSQDPRVRRAVDLICDRYADSLTIEDLAHAARMSRFHFSRLFRQQTGKSPYRYLLDVRMSRAAQLMRVRRCGVTEAALSVGCSDLGRFGRMFRAAHGVRPSEYLRDGPLAASTSH